jgi:NAD(P)-dependent dehydrogenase (short-subunit alcohol dehydrogenase family)
LSGRVALITGGTSGIGLETARLFLEEGASVAVTGRDADRGAVAEAQLSGSGPAIFIRADAGSYDDAATAVQRVEERFGRLDVLVANAGVGVVAPLSETTREDWQAILDTNVSGYLYAAQHTMAAMRRGGHGGAMVLIGSDAGVVGERAIGAYSVSKAAVIMMAKVLSMDGAPHGIRVNCLCPGYVEPGMRHFPDRTNGPGYVDPPVPPLGRYGQARDIAQGALYLVSDESSFCAGSVLMLEGGITAGIP